jgi:ubiquinol-cytochrome c reductase cytochrome b subunit
MSVKTKSTPTVRGVSRWADERLGISKVATKNLKKVFPDHWSFMLGEITLYTFVILIITGVYLTFFYEPSAREVIYNGVYEPLRGTPMSAAYQSALDISFEVRAGLVMRQMHHWAALLFLAAMVMHLLRVFFTGAFRKPRELNWIIGVNILVLSMFNGLLGYSLLDDLLSGTGVRVAYNIALSIPIAGPWLADIVFGGPFPSKAIIPRFFALHVLILPAAIAGLLAAHLGLVWYQKHTQFRGPGRTEGNVVGSRLFPTYGAKAIGLFFLVTAVVALMGGIAQINPIWGFGPFESSQLAAAVTSAAQPDWYMAWPDGILRLIPGWETRVAGFTIPNPFWGGVVAPGLTFTIMMLWPFIEARITKDKAAHNLLDKPRDRPVRTAFGAAVVTFYVVVTFAASNDVLSTIFFLAPETITLILRALVFLGPLAVFIITKRFCEELKGTDEHPAYPGPSHVVTRTPEGGYDFGHGGHGDPTGHGDKGDPKPL